MDRDYAYRFSDDSYATKDEVKKVLNLANIDHIWDTIINYRSLYYKVLDLFSNDKKPFSICLTNGIINKVIMLEKKIMRLEILKSKYNFNDKKKYEDILRIMCEFNSFKDVNDALIEGIVNSSLTNIPRQYTIISNYYECLKEVATRFSSPLNEMTLKRLYSLLIHGDANKIDDISDIYRTTDLMSNFDTYLNFRHYEGAPVEKIPLIMDQIFDEISENKLSVLIEGAIIYFCINYFKPFECFNEEMATLMLKYYFMHNDDNLVLLPFEETILSLNSADLKKVFLECESSLDLTYFVNKFLDLLEQHLKNFEKDINSLEEKQIQNEVLVEDSFFAQEKNINSDVQNVETTSDNSKFEGLTFERKVSMPVLPKGLDEKDASLVASNLLELCPTLKKGQADFYARHCTIGKYYTIQQYKEEKAVAYETARTSMDNLAELGFYKKEKIRNKFVYTPIIRS